MPLSLLDPAFAVPPAITVAALYRFARFADPDALQPLLLARANAGGIKGTILLAQEGINGTVAGSAEAIATLVGYIRTLPGCAALDVKYSYAATPPFHRMKVRVKPEIVTMGLGDLDPAHNAGTYVAPEAWNALISDPDTIVIDTRNAYEVEVGTFKGALNPETESFGDFPNWFRKQREELLKNGKVPKVAMFCTGGIRCEKSTAFLKSEGLNEVYHLQGGILRYLETVPESESLWQGECFVFDERVAVGHGLNLGSYALCHGCRKPLSPAEQASPDFVKGISCAACTTVRTPTQVNAAKERQRQMTLAAARGSVHLGAPQQRKRKAT
jgi:UPF0176 protein